MKLEKSKKLYDKIFKLLTQFDDLHILDTDNLQEKADRHLYKLELEEKYGIVIKKEGANRNWENLGQFISLGMFGKNQRRTIGCPDDGRQPEDEVLLLISFSTGAYIFGDDYDTEIFNEFFLELKSYGPKYSDSQNKKLYFTLENSTEVYNNFQKILNNFRGKYVARRDTREIEKLEEKLNKLKEIK